MNLQVSSDSWETNERDLALTGHSGSRVLFQDWVGGKSLSSSSSSRDLHFSCSQLEEALYSSWLPSRQALRFQPAASQWRERLSTGDSFRNTSQTVWCAQYSGRKVPIGSTSQTISVYLRLCSYFRLLQCQNCSLRNTTAFSSSSKPFWDIFQQ